MLTALAGKAATGEPVSITGVANAARSLLAAELAARLRRPIALVLSQDDDVNPVLRDLASARPEIHSLAFNPLTATMPGGASLAADDKPAVIVGSRNSLENPAPNPAEHDRLVRTIDLNETQTIAALLEWLDEAEYERVDLVTEPGEFAARGGIVDLFPEDAGQPVRAEFLDDEVVSLRTFDPLSQRSTGRVESLSFRTRRALAPSDHFASELLPRSAVVISETPLKGIGTSVMLVPDAEADLDLGCTPAPRYLGNFGLLRPLIDAPGHRYFISGSTEERCKRLRRLLGPTPSYLDCGLSAGFTDSRTGYTVLTELELYGTPGHRVTRARFKGLPVDNLVTLRPGDYVVHVDYGIGLFEGTRRITHGPTDKDCLVLRFAAGDRVYVPVENLGLVDRYVGAGTESVRLDRLGGITWLAAKARAARASADYAEELLQIQARRAEAKGVSFPLDGQWQDELAASFPHDETPGQIEAMTAVRRDMEKGRPMDRLVCGDVGYGKTEVALRAALKAVVGLKQVAMLVPTTILCYQHYATFRDRLRPFPIRIEMLSRLTSPAHRRQVLADVTAGRVDIVIGTHALLGPGVKFRELGLLILDEEQKFGVRQKERIKQLRTSVDVLILTATPVPRTLYMAIAGLRDISTIHTPPPGRREVLTEVAPWTDSLVVKYVERELSRDGRVFFVHNRIQTLAATTRRLERLFPGTDIAVAHGRMPTRDLEQTYLDFAAGRHQVFLSTAIIESGLDMPNVNTIIVDRADRFGLADLHQLRGRVGRSGRQAYALFVVPVRKEITPEARKRLSALLAYSRLGSGFKLALRDLEIRGAGDLLGTRQHGQVARVGLNLYARMLREAASRIKGETTNPEPELKLEINAFLPDSYIPDSFERVALYRRLLGLEAEAELDEFRTELSDRFGRYPPAAENLFKIALVRIRARKHGLLQVTLKDGKATLVAPEKTFTFDSEIDGLLARLAGNKIRV